MSSKEPTVVDYTNLDTQLPAFVTRNSGGKDKDYNAWGLVMNVQSVTKRFERRTKGQLELTGQALDILYLRSTGERRAALKAVQEWTQLNCEKIVRDESFGKFRDYELKATTQNINPLDMEPKVGEIMTKIRKLEKKMLTAQLDKKQAIEVVDGLEKLHMAGNKMILDITEQDIADSKAIKRELKQAQDRIAELNSEVKDMKSQRDDMRKTIERKGLQEQDTISSTNTDMNNPEDTNEAESSGTKQDRSRKSVIANKNVLYSTGSEQDDENEPRRIRNCPASGEIDSHQLGGAKRPMLTRLNDTNENGNDNAGQVTLKANQESSFAGKHQGRAKCPFQSRSCLDHDCNDCSTKKGMDLNAKEMEKSQDSTGLGPEKLDDDSALCFHDPTTTENEIRETTSRQQSDPWSLGVEGKVGATIRELKTFGNVFADKVQGLMRNYWKPPNPVHRNSAEETDMAEPYTGIDSQITPKTCANTAARLAPEIDESEQPETDDF